MTTKTVPGTKLRNGIYHFNVPIPAEIRDLYPTHKSGTYRGTMRTRDPQEAERQVRALRTDFDRQIADRRRQAEQARLKKLLDPDQQNLLSDLGGVQGMLDALGNLRKTNAFVTAGLGAHEPLEDALPPDVLTDIQAKAQAAADAAYQRTLSAEISRLKKIGHALQEDMPAAPIGMNEAPTGMRELCDKLLAARRYESSLEEKYRYSVRRWIEWHGDLPLDQITRAHLHEFSEALKDMPPGVGKYRKLPMRKCIQVAREEGREAIKSKSRQTSIFHLKDLTSFALDSLALVSIDPFAGFKVSKERGKYSAAATSGRKAFTPAAAAKVMDHARAKYDKDTIDYWAPMIAFYTGARREEIGQLLISDVTRISDMDVMQITDMDPDQKVKNKHSLRGVPVPAALRELGFMEFVERRRQAGGHFLFLESTSNGLQEVRKDARGRLTERYGRDRFAPLLKKLNLKENGIVFHSTRHSWTAAARRAGIDPEIRRMIAGRLEGEDPVEEEYGVEELLAEKLAALDKVAPHVRD